MLSIEQCRELIPDSLELTDKQIEKIRQDLYGLGDLGIESYFKSKK